MENTDRRCGNHRVGGIAHHSGEGGSVDLCRERRNGQQRQCGCQTDFGEHDRQDKDGRQRLRDFRVTIPFQLASEQERWCVVRAQTQTSSGRALFDGDVTQRFTRSSSASPVTRMNAEASWRLALLVGCYGLPLYSLCILGKDPLRLIDTSIQADREGQSAGGYNGNCTPLSHAPREDHLSSESVPAESECSNESE